MFRLSISAVLLLLVPLPASSSFALGQDSSQTQSNTQVRLHWGARPGVSRYRLQLATDREFRDIVSDRVITGTEIEINDLPVGRYFWRIAAFNKTGTLGDFSSAAGIVVSPPAPDERVAPATTTTTNPALAERPRTISVRTIGGWRAAVGDVARPTIAHLRSVDSVEVVATNSNGVTFALDAATGIQLWSTRRPTNVPAAQSMAPLIIRSASGLDDVAVFDGRIAMRFEGKSGRELWRTELRSLPSSAVVAADASGAVIVIIDNSKRRLMVVNGASGQLISDVVLPARVVGSPAAGVEQNGQFFIAYETGAIELRDKYGTLIRSGSAASPATTGPLVVKGRRDNVLNRQDMILVDTREGLTGITAGDLKPLGRVTSKEEMSRGSLVAADLDGDGVVEVMVVTQNGYLLAIHSQDGKMMWDTTVNETPQGIAFADLDGDNVLDVIITTAKTFATALSGRDGSSIWKDTEPVESAANHANAFQSRGLVSVSLASGILVIAGDTSHTGLRAVEFPKAAVRR